MRRAILSLLLIGFSLYVPRACPAQSTVTIPRIEGRFINLVDGVCFCSGTIQAEIDYNPETAFATTRVSADGSFLFTNLEVPPGAVNIDFRGSIFPRVENALSAVYGIEALASGEIPGDSLRVLYNPPRPRNVSAHPSLSGHLEGRVTDAETGNPIPGTRVHMMILFKAGARSTSLSRLEYSVPTNGAGTYRLTESKLYRDIAGLQPGRLHLRGHVWIADLRAVALGYEDAAYTPEEAATFRMFSNTYTRNFEMERLEDEW